MERAGRGWTAKMKQLRFIPIRIELDDQRIASYGDAKLIHITEHGLYLIVDPAKPLKEYHLRIFAEGDAIPDRQPQQDVIFMGAVQTEQYGLRLVFYDPE